MSFCVWISVRQRAAMLKNRSEVRAMISSIAEGLNFGRSNLGLGNCHLRTNTEKEDRKKQISPESELHTSALHPS